MLVFNDHSTSQPQMGCVALPRRGLEDVTGIVSATMLRNTVRDSRMVTPDQGLWLVLEFDSIHDNFPSSTAVYFTSLFSHTNNGLQCDIVRWDALVSWEHGLIKTQYCGGKRYIEKFWLSKMYSEEVSWQLLNILIPNLNRTFFYYSNVILSDKNSSQNTKK